MDVHDIWNFLIILFMGQFRLVGNWKLPSIPWHLFPGNALTPYYTLPNGFAIAAIHYGANRRYRLVVVHCIYLTFLTPFIGHNAADVYLFCYYAVQSASKEKRTYDARLLRERCMAREEEGLFSQKRKKNLCLRSSSFFSFTSQTQQHPHRRRVMFYLRIAYGRKGGWWSEVFFPWPPTLFINEERGAQKERNVYTKRRKGERYNRKHDAWMDRPDTLIYGGRPMGNLLLISRKPYVVMNKIQPLCLNKASLL